MEVDRTIYEDYDFVDDISMVAPEQLHQADIRLRQAKSTTNRKLGGLAGVLSGDFLQLPPVERGSLARQITETGAYADDHQGPTDAGNLFTDDTARECGGSTGISVLARRP